MLGFDFSFIVKSSELDEVLEEYSKTKQEELEGLITLSDNSLTHRSLQEKNKYYVTFTGYSSTPDQTDSTPFITATGNRVRDGIVAVNFLEFGTKIIMPELFGNKVFTVDDRMHPSKKENVDVWFQTRNEALHFGRRTSYILVLE